MATFISDNQKFHIFSKSPVRANMELFQATNKSGHTVISEEVRTDDIPWFINVPDVNNPPSYVKDPRKNDIIFQGKFNSLGTAVLCKKWDGEKWVDGPNLKDDPILKNKNDDDVIQVHFENNIEYVSDTNNAGTTSDKQAAFVLKANGEMLTHFVSPTDKIYNGIPSNGYGLYLFLDSQLQSETDSNDNGYIANSYAGIIQFNKARSEAASKFKVITFEYIGGYLSKSLDKLEDDLKDYIDEEIKEHNEEFVAHKNNQNSEKHLSQSEVDSLTALTSADKISGIETATQYDYQAETDLDKALSSQISTPNASDETFKNVTVTLHLRDKVLQQSTMPVTSKAIYNHVHKQSVDIEKASNNVTVEEVTTNENERRKYTIAVDGYTTSETDNIVDDIYEKIQATADDINKNVVEHTSNNGIHITDTERVSWNNNEVVLQKHLNDQNSHISDIERELLKNSAGDLQKHIDDTNSHVSEADRALWNSGGNMSMSGDKFIQANKSNNTWKLSLNNSDIIYPHVSDNKNGDKKVPTVNAVTTFVNDSLNEHIEKITDKLVSSPDYKFEYINNISTSGINYTGLIINNQSASGLNSIFKKLTIKEVQPVSVSKLYAHVYRSATRDITSGLLEDKEYILTLEADLSTPGRVILDFKNKLVISNKFYYGIKFTETSSFNDAEYVLQYNYFANDNYVGSNGGITYPSLITNEVQTGTVLADITYRIPCIMEFRDYTIPTSDAVLEKVYGEVSLDNYDEENTNYSKIYGFIIDENVKGYITNIKVKCIDWENDSTKTATYLKILDETNNAIGRSINTQIHGMNKELSFDFSNIELKKDNSYKAVFETEEFTPVSACVRVNYEGERYYTSAALNTPVFDTGYNIILTNGLRSHAIVKFTFEGAAGDVGPMSYNTSKAHVTDRVKHIFPDGYIHDDTKYNNTSLVVSSLGYGFMWKPEKSAHISSIDMVLHCSNGIFYYNPGNLENTILNAQSPVDVCLKVTDTANNKVIGTSKLIQIEPGEKNKRQSVITVPFETGEYVPCVKNKTYLITFHSSAAQETPDVALPIYPSIYEDELPPASDDYTIKKIIKDSNKTTHYTGSDITNETHNSESTNNTPAWPIHLEKLCVKVTTYRYTHPELEHIANAIGDIWEYLATIRNYISQS
jgi:hypothetical protein